MGFKDVMKTVGQVIDYAAERSAQIDRMTEEIMKRSYGINPTEARKVAKTLVTHADVTWK